jgi:hypothetical protein
VGLNDALADDESESCAFVTFGREVSLLHLVDRFLAHAATVVGDGDQGFFNSGFDRDMYCIGWAITAVLRIQCISNQVLEQSR